jgi:hypothetical protein
MKPITTEIFNMGEDLTPVIKPDDKTKFLLTDDECAFINIINLQLGSLKTVLFTMVATIEQQIEEQIKTVSVLKDQFILALANKHSIAVEENKGHALEIDLNNKLLILQENRKE